MIFCLLFTDFRDGKCVNVNVRAYRYRVASKSEHHNEHFSLCRCGPGLCSQPLAALQERLQGILDDHSAFFNCSFSFAVHNETTELALTSGANNYGTPTTSRLTPDNQIPVGSTTKMYTAVTVNR